MRYSKIANLISELANQQIRLIQDSLSSSDLELRVEEVKSGEWKYVFGRMELDEAWIAGFNTACILLGVGGGFSTNSDGSIDATTEFEITQNLTKS